MRMQAMTERIPLYFEGKAVDYLCAILAQRPYGEVAPLLADINRQLVELQRQQQPALAPVEVPQKAGNGAAGPAEVPAGTSGPLN